jgi:hypothetical protein
MKDEGKALKTDALRSLESVYIHPSSFRLHPFPERSEKAHG